MTRAMMSWFGSAWLCAAVVFAASSGLAEGPVPATPPTGPAEIINQASKGRDRAEIERASRLGDSAARKVDESANEPDTAAPSADSGKAEPSGTTPEAAPPPGHASHDGPAAPPQVVAEPAADLAVGSIAVEVVGPGGDPLANAEIVLGVMASMGGRTEQRARADANGHHTFTNLAVGTQQAYRVNVLNNGAKFSSTPFRLPDQGGYRVRIPVLGTTHESRLVFQMMGQTIVELRDDRLHITQQAQLANAGSEVFVFPTDGLLVPLPPGFTAFQWRDQMSDQRAQEEKGQGFRLHGSLPPGTLELAWTFDVEREGREAQFNIDLPLPTYAYRVISEAPDGMTLAASNFPQPERVKDEGRDLMFTQVRRRLDEGYLPSITVRLDGIPGPGPGRWIALAFAVCAALYGLSRALAPVDQVRERKAVLEDRKKQLIAQAKQLEDEFTRGEVGPEYRARLMDEITTALAMLLRDEEALSGPTPRAKHVTAV